ncbi:hypothetical protein PHMEG_00016101 [Phytophthora megakarya]|uniref:DDE-1 domain-containing protein n=1 Tax=Phytophthora megakarya TaxID=4795 RepID=A0A225W048_9STRA|nr:hypothetical protein PHMEG_00016101 [Phytophthora megakarya]
MTNNAFLGVCQTKLGWRSFVRGSYTLSEVLADLISPSNLCSIRANFNGSEVLPCEMDRPSVMSADNYYISNEGQDVMVEKASPVVYPLPPYCKSTCQPLDVGIMSTFKSALRNTWVLQQGHSPKKANEMWLDIMKRTIVTWNSISEKCFESASKRLFNGGLIL